MFFQCKNCGGNVIYSPEKREMYCPFCDSEKSALRTEGRDLRICPSCGGELPLTEHTSALKCPYCGNYVILDERVEGEYAPDVMIPFRYGKEAVKKLMRQNFQKCVFAPSDFLTEAKLDSMEGEYVPFWLYDYDVNCLYSGRGQNVRVWADMQTQYVETSVYDIRRDVDMSFEKIPADASKKMPDAVMDLMEPYRYEEMEAYRPEYLSGFWAEKYSVDAQEAQQRTQEKMHRSAEELVGQSVTGYGSVKEKEKRVTVKRMKKSYGLLPVWRYSYKYKGRDYPFYINGQTARIVGRVPVSAGKVWIYGATLWGVLTVILLSAYYGLLML